MPKRIGGKSFERDGARVRVLLGKAALPGATAIKPQWIPPLKVRDLTTPQWKWTPVSAAQIEMDDAVDTSAMGTFMIPTGYAGSVTIKTVFYMSSGSNNIVITHHLYYGLEGESSAANLANYNSGNPYIYTPTDTVIKVEFPITFTAVGGEFLTIYFNRDGTDANDTAVGHVRFWGWKVTY